MKKNTFYLILSLLLSCSTSFGQVIYVDADAVGANNGTSWANAYTSLQSALPLATASNQIWVAEGVYKPHATDRTISFNILTGTKLYGGFEGNETLLSQSDPTNNITVLSGDLAGNDNATLLHTEPTRQDNTYQIVAIKGTNMSGIVIAGFTISGGNANGVLSTAGAANVQYNRERGAAIATQSFTGGSGATISAAFQKCIIEKNTATSVAAYSHFYPSGITNVFCYVDFASCIFRNNYSVTNATVLYHGGGFYQQYNRGNQINCLFYNNTSVNAASAIQCLNSTYDPYNNANIIGAARINTVNSTFTENIGFNSKVIKITNGDNLATFVRNSIIYNNGSATPIESDGYSGGVQTQNTITTNPLFIDAPNDNFRLSCNSIARDSGNNPYISPYTTDLDGLTRINNTTVDLGCYEFINAAALTAIAQNITVELDATGNATITPQDVDNGSLTSCGGLPFTLSLDVTTFNCTDLGANTVTLTANDGVTTSTATATVTVLPYADAQNITVQLDATGNATITAAQLSNGPGACPSMIMTLDDYAFTCADMGTNAVALTVSDGNGNISTDFGIVTIEDNVPPIVVTQNISVAINPVTGLAVITPAMIDNGSTDNCSLTLSLSQTEFLCEDQGANTVTLMATDGEGNQTSATAIVTVTSPFTNFSTSATNSTLCFGNTGTSITTTGSQAGVSYILMDAAENVIAGPTTGTGSGLSFNTGAIPTTTNYNVVAQSVYSTNNALNLDGVNDYVNMGTDNRGITNAITITARVRTYVTGGSQFIVDKYLSAGIGYYLFINAAGQASMQGRDVSGSIKSSGLSTTIVADNTWHEITGVVRNTGWEIWVDGVLENSGAYTLGATGLGTTAPLLAGQFGSTFTPADIDRIAIWNTALSPATILNNQTTCLTGTEANLVALFKLNETAGTVVTDNSPTAINGALVNMTAPACWISGGVDACAVYCNTAMTPGVTVNVQDAIAPVPTLGSLANVNGSCSVTSLTAPTATDNCAGTITGTHNATLPITSNTTVTWTYNDGNGNTSTQTQNVVLSDATAPVANVASLSPVTSECAITSLTAPTATDNCSGTVTGTHNAIFPIAASTSVTWTYTDGSGNSATQTQNIVIDDNTAPVANLASLPTLNAQCEIATLTAPTATDNCAGTITGTHNATLPITTNTTITWTYNDGQGNSSTQTQNVVLNDNTAPVANLASLPNVLGECSVTTLTAPTATDNCEGTITGTHNATLPITSNTTITWTYNDGNGNTSAQTQQVILDDVTAPVPTLASLPTLNAQCSVTSLTAPTATDNCIGTITATHNAVLPITSNSTIVWSYDDGNGNISTQNQSVVLNDNTAPVPTLASLATINSQCEVTSLTAPTALDNCYGTVLGTHSVTLPISASTTIVWMYMDGAGNMVTQNQSVVINDVTAPVANNATLTTVTAQCEVTSLTAPTATDNCEGSITGTHNAVLPITTNTTVTWTYNDGNGNTSTQTQQVVINDNTAPLADLATLTTVTGQCEITSLVAPTATDNCEGTITGTNNVVFPITSSTSVTWTYDDGNGNTSTQTQQVVINDNIAPVADAASLTTLTNSCSIATLTAPTATDNCSGTITGTTTAILPITSSSTITWTFDDGNGNTSTQTQDVVINDMIDPILDQSVLADVNSSCPLTSLTAPTATDNCSGTLTGISDAIFPITGVVVVTWTFTDGNGNSVTQTQNVNVNDNIDPIADVATLTDLQSYCAITSLTAPTATDNCSGTIIGVTTTLLPITSNTTITWTFTDLSGNTISQDQDVFINSIGTGVTQNEITLTATNATATAYQWIDCGNGDQAIAGATNQSFTATSNGSYAVVVYEGACSDTSTCVAITTVGIDEFANAISMRVQPNPSYNDVTIITDKVIEQVLIYNLTGELVQIEKSAAFSVESLATGIYVLKVQTTDGNGIIRLVKE